MSLHPSRFPKRADGTRFEVFYSGHAFMVLAGNDPVCSCRTKEQAKMVAAALEFQARDGETFPLEEKPCT